MELKKVTIIFQKKELNFDIHINIGINDFIKNFLKENKIKNYNNYELFSLKQRKVITGLFNEIEDGCKLILQVKSNKIIENNDNKITEIPNIEIEFNDYDRGYNGQIENSKSIEYSNYKKYDIEELFDDTKIKKCFINKKTLKKILELCEQSVKPEKKYEYGGFLIGKYLKIQDNTYNIFIEEFVIPSKYAFHNEYRIDFGDKAMLELDIELQKDNKSCLIGWFHTHPGHTVFLSSYDLNVHYGSFIEAHQVAIVTDTLTENFSTSIFTRKQNMEMNNKNNLKTQFDWKS